MKVLNRLYHFFASFAFAIMLLSFLLLLTFLGTIAQVDQSLYEVQKQYFESTIVFEHVFGIAVPLPGVKLLLGLLCVNLVLGGLVRIRKNGATAGIIIAHLGILWMLVAGLVEYAFSTKGHLTVWEGADSDEFVSFYEWEITVNVDGAAEEWVIPGKQFADLKQGGVARFHQEKLPFDLVLDTVYKNAEVLPASMRNSSEAEPVGGYFLRSIRLNKEAEADEAGCYATIREKEGGATPQRFLLWSQQKAPYVAEVGGVRYLIDLHRRRWQLPFDIKLLDFRKIDHPGIGMVKSFESDVTKMEGGVSRNITISMNQPLRHKGYTLFQSNWGPQQGKPQRYYSLFSVVKNPADAWPMYACYLIGFGLVIHFVRKLLRHVRSQLSRSRA